MKLLHFVSVSSFALLLMSFSSLGVSAEMAGVPVKHPQSVANCAACHNEAVPTTKPTTDKCISCHGPMKNIKVAQNPQGKNPHNSDHYGDTIDCTACHKEHRPSKAVCVDCHVVEFKNLK